jgi:hypothetical protein
MASKKKGKAAATATTNSKAETKAQKFARLGAMRTIKAVNAMRGLQKLSNRNNYEFSDAQVEKILGALKSEVEAVYNAFTKKGGEAKESFTL